MIGSFFVTNGITLICMIYIMLIITMYFMKGKIRGISSKVFVALLFSTVITMIFHILWGAAAVKSSDFTLLAAKVSTFIIICWNYMLIFYMSIAFKTEEENKEFYTKHNKISYVLGTIMLLINLILVIVLDYETNLFGKVYLMGGNLNLYTNIMGGVSIIYAIITLIINRKRLDKVTPLLATTVISICTVSIMFGITEILPLNDICFLHTMVIMFLYLSLESQDKAILEQFNKSNEDAKKSNELKSEFIMNMSHQLRTPMNTILGFSDSLLSSENINQSELIEDALSIESASKKLLDLINSLLEISRLDSDKEVLLSEDYTLESIIYDLSSNINSQVNKEKISFTINANFNCPNDLNGDAHKLSRILNIVLSNVVKNCDFGEISLNISSSVVDGDYHEFTFHIKNSGSTRTTIDVKSNFEDLIKLNSEVNNDIDADALKIITVKGLLDLMGGTIDLIDKTGQGIQYVIKLKQKVTTQNELGNIRDKIQLREETSQIKLDLTGKKVLIIDDQKINSQVLQRLLRQFNIEAEETMNPRDGIDKITNGVYDLVFVNHEMEEMSGEDVVAKLETTGNKIPPIIALLTGATEIKDNKNYTKTLNCPIEFRYLNKVLKEIYENQA